MPYLMSDVAAGSNAATTLMQNMGGAPLAAQAGQAQQEQVIANAQKAKLQNLITETGFKASQDAKVKLEDLARSPDFIAADDGEKLRMISAVQMQAGDVENGAKTLASSETVDAKRLAAEKSKLDTTAQQIGNAYGVLSAVPDNQVDEYVKRLPPQTIKPLVDAVGPENWNRMSGHEKREAAKNLMLNAKGQLQTQLKQLDIQRQEGINNSRERIANTSAQWHMNTKTTGGTKEDLSTMRAYNTSSLEIGRKYNRIENNLKSEISKLETEVQFGKIQNKPNKEAESALESRKADLQQQQEKRLREEISAAKMLPEGAQKKRIVEELVTQAELIGLKTDSGKAAPSNKYTEDNPAQPSSKEEYDKLPAGSYYKQDGVIKRKKG